MCVTARLSNCRLTPNHEPFGAINIERIKRALDEEDFAELQSLYHLMQRDLKIAGAVLARRQPLLQLRYTVTSDNQAFVDWVTDNVDIAALVNLFVIRYLFRCVISGCAVHGSRCKLVPSFRHIPPRFLHAHKGEHLKNTAEHLYIKQGMDKRFVSKLDGDKHVFHKHPIDAGEMTDFSLASKLVWYFSLKHIALAHNLQYFDAVATPPLIAKTEGDEDEVINTLFGLKSAGVAVFNKDDMVEFLNVSSKAEFLQFIEYIDRQIATVILGNTLSTGEGSKGSYSQSKVHENRQREVLAFDAMLISQCITRFLNRLERLNFANAKGVKFAFDLKEKQDLNELSQVVKNLSDSGFELDAKDIEEQFGLKVLGKKPVPGTPADRPNTQENNRMAVNATSTNNSTSAFIALWLPTY